MSISDDLILRARELSTATVHEAYDRLGALPHRIKPLDRQMHVAGRALPVRCPAGDNLYIHHAVAAATKNDVLVIDCGEDGDRFGYWGEIMVTAAQARGISGLIITGGVRDSLRCIEMKFPIFAGAISILGTGKNSALDGQVGEPIRIGEVTVRKGDLVIGDADGVVVVDASRAKDIVDNSIARDAKEAEILEKIRRGALTTDVYKFD